MHNISNALINWYFENSRNLPWRETKDPYKIWLSEIILQQTKVDQGKPYYLHFIHKYPTLRDLAKAPEEEILRSWQGLGYYSRARNLLKTAQIVASLPNSTFPTSYEELIKLPGIGSYTAAAIASFCYEEPVAVVDGNVYRFLSRYFNIETPINSTEGIALFKKIANELIPLSNAGTYNQSIMEFGALQCVPNNPNCGVCPFVLSCESLKLKLVTQRPKKLKKRAKTKRYLVYHYSKNSKFLFLKKNKEKGVFLHMYEFPKMEFSSENEFLKKVEDLTPKQQYTVLKHELSHIQLNAVFMDFLTDQELANYVKIDKKEIDAFPLPRLITKFLENEGLN